jgi:hypothetical protein
MDQPKQLQIYTDITKIPKEAYKYYHDMMVEFLNNNYYKDEFVKAGLAGISFTEKYPDVPDNTGGFTYRFAQDGAMSWSDQEGEAVVSFPSYAVGYRAFGDANFNSAPYMTPIKNAQKMRILFSVLPQLRAGLRFGIEAMEKKYNILVPKYW